MRLLFTFITIFVGLTLQAAKAPDWVRNRPVDEDHYIGIGSAPITSDEYERIARDKALADLVSEISVTIESNSLLKRIDINGEYSELYTNDIRNKSQTWLEDYELVDTYNDGKIYRVYYRIGKVRYAKMKQKKAGEASMIALDNWEKGNDALSNGNMLGAAKFYTAGIKAIEPFSDMRLMVDHEGTSMNIALELETSLAAMLGGFTMQSTPATVNVKPFTSTPADVLIKVSSGNNSLSNIPLQAVLDGNKEARVTAKSPTDIGGHAHIYISAGAVREGRWTLIVTPEIELEPIFDTPALKAIYTMLAPRFTPLKVPVTVAGGTIKAVCIAADSESATMTELVKKFINNKYFDIVDNESEADLKITVSAHTHKGESVRNDFSDITKYICSAKVSITDLKDHSTVATTTAEGEAGLRSGKPEATAVKTASANAMKTIRAELSKQLKNKNFTPRDPDQDDNGQEANRPDFFNNEYQ